MSPQIDPEVGCVVPEQGQWPVDPQDDVPIREDRLWIDGCFDFFHHGHAGVMLQSRRFGNELLVGLHSDEDIAQNKGPTVMNLAERVAAVNACRFSTLCVPHAPYVTSIPWISHYGCKYVTHGDDVTSDASGEDCYRFVKKAGRMKIVPRTPGISTTDLVGRMLTTSKDHFISDLVDRLDGEEGGDGEAERKAEGEQMRTRIQEYAAAANGIDPFVKVYSYRPGPNSPDRGTFTSLVPGIAVRPGQRVVYVDGGFDLFSSGHIAFLQSVTAFAEHDLGHAENWYHEDARQKRIQETGSDYGPVYLVVGIHDDSVINAHRGINYPIMNIFERGLCVVQCAYVSAVVFGAPYTIEPEYFAQLGSMFFDQSGESLAGKKLDAVYHGPTPVMQTEKGEDPYRFVKTTGIYKETPVHEFHDVNAAQIVQRILDRRDEYEERQRKKGVKSVGEQAHRRKELEEEQRLKEQRDAV